MPKIFISHSWEDKAIARKIDENLRRDGAEVWIDYARIEGGDSLPKVIGEAIQWCDTLILVWSKSAEDSYFVGLEWECALTNKKRIIPCLIDEAVLPFLLTSRLFIHLQDYDTGYPALVRALKLEIRKIVPKPETEKMEEKAPSKSAEAEPKPAVPKEPEKETVERPKPEVKTSVFKAESQFKRLVVDKKQNPDISKKKNIPALQNRKKWLLRAEIILAACVLFVGGINLVNKIQDYSSENSSQKEMNERGLSFDEVKQMLINNDFYSKEYDWNKEYCNPAGKGIANDFEVQQNGQVVFDKTTGLMWQQGGSSEYMNYEKAEEYIDQLNQEKFAGYNDWRLPTLKEAMSLMEPEKKNGDLYIDPKFDQTQSWIWTADLVKGESWAWVVGFSYGRCYLDDLLFYGYVRGVRSGQLSGGY